MRPLPTLSRRGTFLAAAVLLAAAGHASASDVIDLTKDSFNEFVDKEPLALVEFFAPWYVSVRCVDDTVLVEDGDMCR